MKTATNRAKKQTLTHHLTHPNKFRMIILKSEIDCLFLHAWIKFHKISIDQLQLTEAKRNSKLQKYEITNDIILDQLEYDYRAFKESKQSVEDFLNVDIVIFRENGQGNFFTSKTECLDRRILILCQTRRSVFILNNIAFSELNSTHPIEMSIKSIFSIYDIQDTITILPFQELNIYGFEDKYQVCVDIYKRNGNRCQKYYDVPGNREPRWFPKHRIKVAVDYIDIPYLPKYYWIPCDSLITKKMFCTKLPGICAYSTTKSDTLKDHEKSCSDQTKVESKQVNIFYNFENLNKI